MKNAFIKFGKTLFAAAFVIVAMSAVPAKDAQQAAGLPAAVHEKTFTGTSRPLGAGTVRSWARVNHGKLVALGVTFDEDALKGLPEKLPAGQESVEYLVPLPREAAGSVFDHIGINWNPNGHPPSDIYSIGHFDFHFYLLSPEERRAITGKGDDVARANKPLPAEYVPEGYILAPDSVIPEMGAHWVDPKSHEFHGHEFDRTFLYGSYDGRIIFLEPMITRAYLETRPNVTEAIKLPAKFSKQGYYPTKYSVRYDAARREYAVALEEMVLR